MSEKTSTILLYTIDEVSRLLSIGRTSVYALIDDRQLERVKIGRRSLVPAESIAEYVRRLRVEDSIKLDKAAGQGASDGTTLTSDDDCGR